jgi:hypothetical protein
MQTVTLPDGFSGREVTCTSCQNTFEAPIRYNPTVLSDSVPPTPPAAPIPGPTIPIESPVHSMVQEPSTKHSESSLMSPENPADRPPLPPGLVPISTGIPPASPSTASEPLPTGYTKSHALTISPRVVVWLPAIFLTIALFCTFFPWVGTYIGWSPVDSQGMWRAISGYPDRNIPNEKAMHTPPDWLDKVKSDWLLMVPYFLSLLAATVIAWVERFEKKIARPKFPPLSDIWPWLPTAIIGLSGIALFLMLIQLSYGFGLERAMQEVVSEQFSSEREAAAGSPTNLKTVKWHEEQECKKFNMRYTFWLNLCVLCNFLAVLTALCRMGFEKRGPKPPPRIVIQY